jgi:adenylylsulfate kinase
MWVALMTSTQTRAPAGATGTSTGVTLWLTGLPSAGKTTLAVALAQRLRADGVDVEVLDGDEVRTHLSAGLGFSRADRDTHVDRIGFVAELLARHGVVVLVPVIAPYARARDGVREHHRVNGTRLLQVHVSTPIETCAERDVKGLYAKAFRGEISSMTGVDDPYEVPVNPDLRIDTAGVDKAGAVDQLVKLLRTTGVIR